MKTDKLRRLTAASLVLAFTLPQAAQAAEPTVETDESVYINMDYYGAPTNTRIVKGVSLNGHTEFTDFGSYADVYNMSTYDEPVIKDNSVYWKLSDTSKQRFYYECIPTDKVNIQMPWNFDVSYKLNGVSVKAEDCAGAKRSGGDHHSRSTEQLRKRLLQKQYDARLRHRYRHEQGAFH